MADIFHKVIDQVDNFRPESDPTLWKFFVFEVPYPVGFIRDHFFGQLKWDTKNFSIEPTERKVTLNPTVGKLTRVQACDEAMIDFCEQNRNGEEFSKALNPWLNRSADKRDWHAIFGLPAVDLELLRVPTPVRGIFGIVTAGIHVNVFQTKKNADGKDVIDIIWLSQRSQQATFPLSYDQICAGALDPADKMDPMRALEREAFEEMGMTLANDGKTMLYEGKQCGRLCGELRTISIYTLKGPMAGIKETGHLEPALRFSLDLHLDAGFVPRPHDPDAESFMPFKVEDLAKSAFNVPWKYSSGAVMVDWCLRHRLMGISEQEAEALLKRLHYPIPFQNAQKYL